MSLQNHEYIIIKVSIAKNRPLISVAYIMKIIACSIFFFAACSSTVYAVTENDLQDVADCIAAISITNASMQLNGDHKNYKVGERVFTGLMSVFYEKLTEYRNSNPNINSAYLGQMPNRAAAQYSYMGELQQLKYAQSVLSVNRCFQYTR